MQQFDFGFAGTAGIPPRARATRREADWRRQLARAFVYATGQSPERADGIRQLLLDLSPRTEKRDAKMTTLGEQRVRLQPHRPARGRQHQARDRDRDRNQIEDEAARLLRKAMELSGL
jgi:hypothetical protein